MAGWFKIQRDIENHWIWKSSEPFDKRSAWIDLIMLANYADRKTTDGESVVLRKRGDVNYSMLFLAKRWKWDRRKVRRFLVALESDGMVSLHGTQHGTTITIENYAKWQGERATNSTTNRSTGGQQTIQQADTEEELIEELIEEGDFVPPSSADVISFFEENNFESDPMQFFNWYDLNKWTKKNGDPIDDWQTMARSWEQREKGYIEERKSKNGRSNVPVQPEPPHYPEFEPEPERKAEPPTEEQRKRMRETLS